MKAARGFAGSNRADYDGRRRRRRDDAFAASSVPGLAAPGPSSRRCQYAILPRRLTIIAWAIAKGRSLPRMVLAITSWSRAALALIRLNPWLCLVCLRLYGAMPRKSCRFGSYDAGTFSSRPFPPYVGSTACPAGSLAYRTIVPWSDFWDELEALPGR